MKRYKLLKKLPDGRLVSVLADKGLRVTYEEGKWVSAPEEAMVQGYGCTVFTSPYRALSMGRPPFGSTIALVHCQGLMELPDKLSIDIADSGLQWLRSAIRNGHIDDRGWPPDTQMFAKVKIIKLVDVGIMENLAVIGLPFGLYETDYSHYGGQKKVVREILKGVL